MNIENITSLSGKIGVALIMGIATFLMVISTYPHVESIWNMVKDREKEFE